MSTYTKGSLLRPAAWEEFGVYISIDKYVHVGGFPGLWMGAASDARWCLGCVDWDDSAWLATSAAVSVAAQKLGGEFTHPMGSTSGNATRGSGESLCGNTTPRQGTSVGERSTL